MLFQISTILSSEPFLPKIYIQSVHSCKLQRSKWNNNWNIGGFDVELKTENQNYMQNVHFKCYYIDNIITPSMSALLPIVQRYYFIHWACHSKGRLSLKTKKNVKSKPVDFVIWQSCPRKPWYSRLWKSKAIQMNYKQQMYKIINSVYSLTSSLKFWQIIPLSLAE